MASQETPTAGGPNPEENPFGHLVISNDLDLATLNDNQVKLVAEELYKEFKSARKVENKALIAFAINHLVKKKNLTPESVLDIHASIKLTKFLVTNVNNFVYRD